MEPVISNVFVTMPPYDCFGLHEDKPCQFTNVGSVKLTCPSLWRGKQSKPATVTISNPQDEEQEYHASVNAIIQFEDRGYRVESICSNTLTVAPREAESFICDFDPRTIETKGRIVTLQAVISPEGKGCAGSDTVCSTQPYLALYCLIPALVAFSSLWWFIKIDSSKEESVEPAPDSEQNDI